MKEAFSKKKFVTDADPFTKAFSSTALASTSALASMAVSHAMPLVVGSFLHQHGLSSNLEESTFSQAFPSETHLRKLMIDQAASNAASLSQELEHKKVFVSCDKGHKRKPGHFVRCLSWWCDTNSVL